jgi:ankyrin repeat protein
VVSRPLRVEELAELLAFDFEAGQIPTFHEDWRLEDPVEAVLSTCSTLLSLVNAENSQVIQFSHFSVKEFLTSTRFSEKHDTISNRYHVSLTPAHTLVAQACLGILLHLDKGITRSTLPKFPLAGYAAEHWFEHARVEGVSQNALGGMKQLFDWRKPHLAIWLWIFDPILPFRSRDKSEKSPLTPPGNPLHYASFCGLHDIVKVLAIEHPQDVNSQSFLGGETPLHVTSRVDVARLLIEHGADATAQSKDGTTPLHLASERGHVDLARLLIEHGADTTAQSEVGTAPLHQASFRGRVDVARLLIERGADVTAQSKGGMTPLHQASLWGHVDVARLLIEHGADATAQSKDWTTPLHQASKRGNVDVARLLIEHGADVTAQSMFGATPLRLASKLGHVDLARLLIEHGADGKTPQI